MVSWTAEVRVATSLTLGVNATRLEMTLHLAAAERAPVPLLLVLSDLTSTAVAAAGPQSGQGKQ